MIRFNSMYVSPEIATELLKGNIGNRNLSRRTVETLARDMLNGGWRLTHQCIALSEAGTLIDGQHRLSAVVASGVTVPMCVAHYTSDATAMALPIDLHKKRSHTDILKCNPRHAEIANSFSWIVNQRAATTSEAAQMISAMEPHISHLHAAVVERPKARGAAGARAGIIYRMITDPVNADIYATLYRAFCLLHFDDLNTSIMSLIRSLDGDDGRFNGSQGRTNLFVRIIYAFDLNNPDRKLIRITEDVKSEILAKVRVAMTQILTGGDDRGNIS